MTSLVVLHSVAAVTLTGGLGWLAILERVAQGEGWASMAAIDRWLRITGWILSVSLAVAIFSGLALYYLRHGSFTWDTATPWSLLLSVKSLLFLGFWVHWGWTEVVGLDGMRKSTPPPGATAPGDAWPPAHARAWRAMRLLLAEASVLLILGILSGLA